MNAWIYNMNHIIHKSLLIAYLIFEYSHNAKGDYFTVNWTEASVAGMKTETHYQDPSVTPLAPCPCDLTSYQCDARCCCDKDCSEIDKDIFTCLEGIEGGQQSPQDFDYSCNYLGPYSPEWHSLLCYITNNNPYLGLFFKNENVIQEFQKYSTRVRAPKYSFETSILQVEDSPFHFHYKAQASVETLFQSNSGIFRSPLFLPQPVLHGICVNTIPIHFLKNFKHQCSTMLSERECESNPMLSSELYLQENAEGKTDNIISVISDLNTLEVVSASVKYLCLKNSLKFIKVNGLSKTASEFMRKRWDTMEEYFDECQVKNKPLYNSTTHMCENVVLSVDYSFAWKGTKITEVNVEIILGDIPISLDSIHQNYLQQLEKTTIYGGYDIKGSLIGHKQPYIGLLQNFETNFNYVWPAIISNETSSNLTFNNESFSQEEIDSQYVSITKVENITERSGNPGYDIGRPLLAGYVVYNNTDAVNDTQDLFSFVDINDATGLLIWRPDATSICSLAFTEEVIFGVDMLSTCIYSLDKNYTCDDVKLEIFSMMSQLIQADMVSKMGSPNITSKESFLPIITDTNDPGNEPDRCYVPTALQYEIIYRDIADPGSRSFTINQVIGISTRFHYSEVVIASGGDSSAILLSSSVKYFESPKPSQLSRFWETMEDRWCADGICWRELMYPWTHGAGATYGLYSESIINLMRNSALIALLSLPILYFIIQRNLGMRF
ncbi:tectonic-2-like [Macrobrachium rosenbergii]|uniref:tectonic-2-like n=1 Tax=Macrobrachium rosenbergii TaxID=79674 RepID=UPI0034D4EA88